jgi:hypothetical protein
MYAIITIYLMYLSVVVNAQVPIFRTVVKSQAAQSLLGFFDLKVLPRGCLSLELASEEVLIRTRRPSKRRRNRPNAASRHRTLAGLSLVKSAAVAPQPRTVVKLQLRRVSLFFPI